MQLLVLVAGVISWCTLLSTTSQAGFVATLIATDTLIDQPLGGPIDASGAVTVDGYALNRRDLLGGQDFIDVAVYLFDFGPATSVSNAILTMSVLELYALSGQNPTINLFTYADDAAIQVGDFAAGAGTIRDSFTYSSVGQAHSIDVTAAVNEALLTSQYVGFRFENSRAPSQLTSYEGVRLGISPTLTFDAPAGAVPEPASLALFALGSCALALTAGRRRRPNHAADRV